MCSLPPHPEVEVRCFLASCSTLVQLSIFDHASLHLLRQSLLNLDRASFPWRSPVFVSWRVGLQAGCHTSLTWSGYWALELWPSQMLIL